MCSPTSDLWETVKSDSGEHLRELLTSRADALARTPPFGLTLMHVAVGHGCLSTAQVLLEHGVSINIRSQDGETPLHMAAHENRQKALHWLLEHRACVNSTNEDGETPLHAAMQSLKSQGGVGHIQALVEARADISARDADGRSAMEHAQLFSNGNSEALLSLFGKEGPQEEKTKNVTHPDGVDNHIDTVDAGVAEEGEKGYPEANLEGCGQPDRSIRVDIGAKVRVLCDSVTRRATVACFHSDKELEIIFDDDNSESVVDRKDVSCLQDFEDQPPICREGDLLATEVGRCREEGNTLFRLKDAAAAAERYTVAIDALGIADHSCSKNVIAMVQGSVWLGKGSWKDGEEFGMVHFLRPVDRPHALARKKPSARSIQRNKVLAVRADPLADVQVALYLNRARCWLSLGAYPRALRDCELASALRRANRSHEIPWFAENWHKLVWPILVSALALALVQINWVACMALLVAFGTALLGLLTNTRVFADGEGDVRLCTAAFLRARARLNQGRLRQAETELRRAGNLAPGPSQVSELHQLKREILEAKRDNRRLAKEVAKWCEAAMAKAKPDAFGAVADQ